MLHTQNTRSPLTRRGWSIAAIVALAVSLPLAAAGVAPADTSTISTESVTPMTPPAEGPASTSIGSIVGRRDAGTQTGSIAGTVVDQSDGRLPGVTVTLTGPNGATATAITNSRGHFEFRDLPTTAHELSASLAGFARVRATVTPAAGTTTEHAVTLPVGALTEAVNINCSPTFASAIQRLGRAVFPVLAAQEQPAIPVRVGGNIRPPKKVNHVNPVCPAGTPTGQTTVILSGTIGVDGVLYDLALLRPVTPADLNAASLDAVQQWTFTPTLLNGQPVEVHMTVTVTFTKE